MQLYKTELARAELRPGTRSQGQRERSVLLMADGVKTLGQLGDMFNGAGLEIVTRLMRDGYLTADRAVLSDASASATASPVAKAASAAPVAPAAPVQAQTQPGSWHTTTVAMQLARAPVKTPAAVATTAMQPAPAVSVSADTFEGKRSLATVRMFLFDLTERMFARRDPAMAEQFRNALRDAKDRDTMLAVSRDMIDEIEKVAGHERADSISERLAMLLPSQ